MFPLTKELLILQVYNCKSTIMNEQEFYEQIVKNGTYYNPAEKHYLVGSIVNCDRCLRTNIESSIGYYNKDLCMACVSQIELLKNQSISIPVGAIRPKKEVTFYFHASEQYKMTSVQLADIICHVSEVGCIMPRMAYMHGYEGVTKFTSKNELVRVIDEYCEKYNTDHFDYSEMYVIFSSKTKRFFDFDKSNNLQTVKKISVRIHRIGLENTNEEIERMTNRVMSDASNGEATRYQYIFPHIPVQIPTDAKIYLPPYFNSSGKQIGGGMPGFQ